MKTFYLFNEDQRDEEYPDNHIAGKIALFLNKAVNFKVLERDYDLDSLAVAPAESATAIQMAIQNEYFFILKLSKSHEELFLSLYDSYELIANDDRFVDYVMSTNHPIGDALQVYERAVIERLELKAITSQLRYQIKSQLEGFMETAPKAILGEMKHCLEIIPNRCRVRVRYAHFLY